jgi:hypothetical protein
MFVIFNKSHLGRVLRAVRVRILRVTIRFFSIKFLTRIKLSLSFIIITNLVKFSQLFSVNILCKNLYSFFSVLIWDFIYGVSGSFHDGILLRQYQRVSCSR